MFTLFCRFIFALNGWKVVSSPPDHIQKSVMIGAPHTSNWDFIYSMAACHHMKITNPRFTIKQEWMRFPFHYILGPLGAIPINRSSKQGGEKRPNMVELMTRYIEESENVAVMVTPEATRSPVKRWKSGFYRVAFQANVPILLAYLDYEKREAGIGKVIYPCGDLQKDLREILDFYNTITPKYPEKYIKL
jgi:1-acyl-sn-glycerol-3-phosphate acyltransferase